MDRPLSIVLQDVRAALDPSGAVLRWNATQRQPCRPWITSNGVFQGQSSASPGYGGGWTYVSTTTSVVGSAEFCQDVGSAPYVTLAATTTNSAPVGGIAALLLPGLGLSGSLPCQLGQLKTITSLSLASNYITGFLPFSEPGRTPRPLLRRPGRE